MKKTTREWARKAEQDYATAKRERQGEQPVHDVVCFHCQQCAEKYLKALQEELGLLIAKTHDLDQLLNDLLPHHAPLRSLRRGLLFLSQFAVDTRYPGYNARKSQAVAATRWMDRIRDVARSILGLRERQTKK
jgi:HEPN domain-containing protein